MLSTFPQCTTDLPHASSETGQVYGLGPRAFRAAAQSLARRGQDTTVHRTSISVIVRCSGSSQLPSCCSRTHPRPQVLSQPMGIRSASRSLYDVCFVFVGNHTSLYNALRIISHYSRNRHNQEIWPVHLLMPILSGYDTTQCQTPLLVTMASPGRRTTARQPRCGSPCASVGGGTPGMTPSLGPHGEPDLLALAALAT